MRVADVGEFGLIRQLISPKVSMEGVIVSPGDDAAVVEISPGMRVVYTCDCMVEDVHFFRYVDGSDVGYKLLASNVSDIAAMGGRPRYAVVTVVTPPEIEVAWLMRVYAGLYECAGEHGVAIVGGDTSRGPKVMLNVALIGEVAPGRELLRGNARVGDLVGVTGPLGGSHAGLQVVLGRVAPDSTLAKKAERRHYRSFPRVREGMMLGGLGCRCANDISDGLVSEAREIAEASRVRLELDAKDIPFTEEVAHVCAVLGEDPVNYALYGGEDYELLFTISASLGDKLAEWLPGAKVVGRVVEGEGVGLRQGTSWRELSSGYTHFNRS